MNRRDITIICVMVLFAAGVGVYIGERAGETVMEARLRPQLEENAAKIASLECELAALAERLTQTKAVLASWYGPGFHGRRTSSGEVFNQFGFTAAHRTLRLGTRLIVTDPDSGRSIKVLINDRGPYIAGRTLDLSLGAARALGIERNGLSIVLIRAIED